MVLGCHVNATKPYCNITNKCGQYRSKADGVAPWQGLVHCIPGCTVIDAIWSIADKVIWVDLGKALRIRKVCPATATRGACREADAVSPLASHRPNNQPLT